MLCCVSSHDTQSASSYTRSLNKLQSTFKVNAISTSRKISSGCRVQVYKRPHSLRKSGKMRSKNTTQQKHHRYTMILLCGVLLSPPPLLPEQTKNAFKTNFVGSCSRADDANERTNERANLSVCQEMSVLWLVVVVMVKVGMI